MRSSTPVARRLSMAVVFGLLYLSVGTGFAQSGDGVTVKGRVFDAESGQPIAQTHVFISGSSHGTTTDSSGSFRLPNVQRGAARLYVSHLGYKPAARELFLPPDTTVTGTFRLEPTVLEQDAVVVTAKRDEEWFENVERFKRLFVGPSSWADRCRLVNPEVLEFETAWWGKFEVNASRPLIFINRALGYRVTYYLDEFQLKGDIIRWDGDPVFEPLPPRDSTEAQRWAENRRTAFSGSLRHFLLSLLHNRVEEENFRIYRQPRTRAFIRSRRPGRIPTSRDRVLQLRSDGPHELDVQGRLEVVYHGARESRGYLEWSELNRAPRDYQSSEIQLNQRPVHIDAYGEIVQPYGATLYDYFAFTRRLATLVPKDYRPPSLSSLPPLTTEVIP